SFQPQDSDWVFFASIQYGRSASHRHLHQQTYPSTVHLTAGTRTFGVIKPAGAKFTDTVVQNGQQHLILDFQAGKDVGLGMFAGKKGTSVFSAGVRFAQFSTKSNIALKSDPDWHFTYYYVGYFHKSFPIGQSFHSNLAGLGSRHSFHGVGPSISWDASAPVVGNAQASEITFDWGLNAALLFGRQKAFTHHHTTARFAPPPFNPRPYTVYVHSTPIPDRTRTIAVPNVGGFAGVSYRFPNAKVSAGYRADLFFGAMDGGIDAAKKENVGFYGPFASVSVGLGG
ncbi:MAG TPA: hypothetical protein VIJ62_09200, partial [Rhizomicrobium sp.]